MNATADSATHNVDQSNAPSQVTEHFHRRVLDRLPTALVVVNDAGLIVYGNEALERIVGWSSADSNGTEIFRYIHPDDLGSLADAFVRLADRDAYDPARDDHLWAPLNFRLISRTGEVVPVEVTGRGSLQEPAVDGIIYEIRPADERAIIHSVLAGVASGGDLIGQLKLVVDLISASLIDINSAVLRVRADRVEVLAAKDDGLRAVLERAAAADELDVFEAANDVPSFHDVNTISSRFGSELAELNFADAWNFDIASAAEDTHYRIVAFTETHRLAAMGVHDRLIQARELISVILLRVRNEQLLDRAAHHDALTDLPNRLGLRRLVDEFADRDGMAMLFVDLDGFKSVNDAHGHRKGDEVLATIARRMVAAVGPDDLVARLGGDEFAVIFVPTAGELLDTAAISNRLIATIEEPIDVAGRPTHISASLGLVDLAGDVDLDTAIGAADQAMYRAKRAGGGQFRLGKLTTD